MIRFEDLVEKVRADNPEADLELLRRPTSSRRSSTRDRSAIRASPTWSIRWRSPTILADMRLDVVAIAAGLLHDIVEDTLTTIERISELFGPDVAHVVEGVTKLGAIPFSSSEERQAENFRKMLLAMVDDIRVILVKLADRLHNMRTLHHLPEERRMQDRAGDARHLRADRQPARHEQDQERARGAVVQVPRAEGLRGAARAGREPARRPPRA